MGMNKFAREVLGGALKPIAEALLIGREVMLKDHSDCGDMRDKSLTPIIMKITAISPARGIVQLDDKQWYPINDIELM